MSALAFDHATHTYTLDGRVLPSVTQVLQAVGLVNSDWFTDEARLRGQYVHAAIALDQEGALDDATLDPALVPYVAAWRQFVRDTGFVALSWEQPVVDAERGYAGTYDVIGRLTSTIGVLPPALIDIKSGAPQAWVALQTAAYARAARTPAMPLLARAALWLRADGTYRYLPQTNRADERVWLAALEVYQWQTANS